MSKPFSEALQQQIFHFSSMDRAESYALLEPTAIGLEKPEFTTWAREEPKSLSQEDGCWKGNQVSGVGNCPGGLLWVCNEVTY